MAYKKRGYISEYDGFTNDVKPTGVMVDAKCYETNMETGSQKVYRTPDGSNWFEIFDDQMVIEKGLATDGSNTTIVDSSKNFETDILKGAIAKIRIGGIEYFRTITSNTTDTITISDLPSAAASLIYGPAEGGQVTIQYEIEGEAGNAITLEVVVSEGNNMALSSLFADGVLTVYLGTDADGLPDNSKNTGAAVATSISEVPNFTATMSGSGGVVAVTESPVEFSGGIDTVEVSAGCEYFIKEILTKPLLAKLDELIAALAS